MAEPASKGVKTSHNNNDKRRIVAFTFQDLKPNTCFKVFDSLELHVHSDILKLRSGFFREYSDSPEIKPPVNSAFKYEWVTELTESPWGSIFVPSSDDVLV
jgi:hypothetical protein